MLSKIKLCNKINVDNVNLRIFGDIKSSTSLIELNRILKNAEHPFSIPIIHFKPKLSREMVENDGKDLVIGSLGNLIYHKCYNYHLWSFVSNGFHSLIPYLNLLDCYKIIKHIIKLNCNDDIINNKRSDIMNNVLIRLNHLIESFKNTQIIDIVKHKYKQVLDYDDAYYSINDKLGNYDHSRNNDLCISDYELCYKIWYMLRGIDDIDVKHTREGLTDLLECNKLYLNRSDIMRVIRILNELFDNKSLDKVEESLVIKLLKKLFVHFSNYKSYSNLTIVHVKKCISIILQSSHIIPVRLSELFRSNRTGLGNFLEIILDSVKNSVLTHEKLVNNTGYNNLISQKSCKLHCRILHDLIELLKFVDLYDLDINVELVDIISELLKSNITDDITMMVMVSRSLYYLILSTGCDGKDVSDIHNRVFNTINMMYKTIKDIHVTTDHLHLVLYHDKILNLLSYKKTNVFDGMISIICKLSNEYKLFTSSNHIIATLYVTTLNKYNYLNDKILYAFIDSLDTNWSKWSNHEISMLTDLLNRINVHDEIHMILKSLYNKLNLDGLNNNQLISSIKCIKKYNVDVDIQTIINKRITKMNYKQLIKLLSLNVTNEDAILNRLSSIGIYDITNLITLLDRTHLKSRIFNMLEDINDIEVVNDNSNLDFLIKRNKIINKKFTHTRKKSIISINAATSLLQILDANHSLYNKLQNKIHNHYKC